MCLTDQAKLIISLLSKDKNYTSIFLVIKRSPPSHFEESAPVFEVKRVPMVGNYT